MLGISSLDACKLLNNIVRYNNLQYLRVVRYIDF